MHSFRKLQLRIPRGCVQCISGTEYSRRVKQIPGNFLEFFLYEFDERKNPSCTKCVHYVKKIQHCNFFDLPADLCRAKSSKCGPDGNFYCN